MARSLRRHQFQRCWAALFTGGSDDDKPAAARAASSRPVLSALGVYNEAYKHQAIDHAILRHLLCHPAGTFAFADSAGLFPRHHHHHRYTARVPLPPPPQIWMRKEGRLSEIVEDGKSAILDDIMPSGSINVRRNRNLGIPTYHRALPAQTTAPPSEEPKEPGSGKDWYEGLTPLEIALLLWSWCDHRNSCSFLPIGSTRLCQMGATMIADGE
ncbi:hypothetical protein MBLNU459_g0928t2 [Dothideomycetes sp. NU459]